MRICGSERCSQVVALGCFATAATLIALAALYGSGTIKGIGAYRVAVGCGTSALVPLSMAVALFWRRTQKGVDDSVL